MSELQRILEAAARARREAVPAVLATVVQVSGSTYRRPGARMLIPARGEATGFLSGGCLEGDLVERAREVLASGEPRTVVYDMRSPDDIVWGLGLGCAGEVRVLLEPLQPGAAPASLERLAVWARERRAGVMAVAFSAAGAVPRVGRRCAFDDAGTPLDPRDPWNGPLAGAVRGAVERGRSASASVEGPDGRSEWLVERVAPPPCLALFGAGSDAVPVVRLAARVGWRVEVADHREAYATPDRFPEADRIHRIDFARLAQTAPPLDAATAAVSMTHHFLHDLELLGHLIGTAAPYVGFLGPRARMEHLLRELRGRGVEPSAGQRERLYAPVGLDIGSDTPEEIAVALVAEIRAVLSGRRGGFLRERGGPLHERDP